MVGYLGFAFLVAETEEKTVLNFITKINYSTFSSGAG
jgi:hypothetical protein